MKINKPIEKFITLGAVLLVAGVMYLLSATGVLELTCLIKAVFGISCPGCGMTRAYLSLLRLDIAAAFRYNPMFWSIPILAAYYLFDGRIFKQKWLNTLIIAGLLSGLVICWVIRLILRDPIVI